MHARSTTFRGERDDAEAGIAFVRDEAMPALTRLPGNVGLSMLVDRETGGCIVTSSWETAQAMRGAELTVAPLRDRAARLFGGRPEVREWEISLLHRARPVPPGARARVTWTRTAPGQVEQLLELIRTVVLPQVEDLDGFCSFSLLVDRATGMCASSATYDTQASLERSSEAASDLRMSAATMTSSQIVDVASFDVVLAHLRVPETV